MKRLNKFIISMFCLLCVVITGFTIAFTVENTDIVKDWITGEEVSVGAENQDQLLEMQNKIDDLTKQLEEAKGDQALSQELQNKIEAYSYAINSMLNGEDVSNQLESQSKVLILYMGPFSETMIDTEIVDLDNKINAPVLTKEEVLEIFRENGIEVPDETITENFDVAWTLGSTQIKYEDILNMNAGQIKEQAGNSIVVLTIGLAEK